MEPDGAALAAAKRASVLYCEAIAEPTGPYELRYKVPGRACSGDGTTFLGICASSGASMSYDLSRRVVYVGSYSRAGAETAIRKLETLLKYYVKTLTSSSPFPSSSSLESLS